MRLSTISARTTGASSALGVGGRSLSKVPPRVGDVSGDRRGVFDVTRGEGGACRRAENGDARFERVVELGFSGEALFV